MHIFWYRPTIAYVICWSSNEKYIAVYRYTDILGYVCVVISHICTWMKLSIIIKLIILKHEITLADVNIAELVLITSHDIKTKLHYWIEPTKTRNCSSAVETSFLHFHKNIAYFHQQSWMNHKGSIFFLWIKLPKAWWNGSLQSRQNFLNQVTHSRSLMPKTSGYQQHIKKKY